MSTEINVKLAFYLAWRSLGRNKRRTWVSIVAISVGMGLSLLMLGFGDGMYQRTIENAVKQNAGNLVSTTSRLQAKTFPRTCGGRV